MRQILADGKFLASLSSEELRVWRRRDWECVSTVPWTRANGVGGLDFHPSQPFLAAKNLNYYDPGGRARPPRIDCFKVDYALLGGVGLMPDSSRYVNAKVVLLGDTGVGKSGLGLVLSGQPYQPTDSTHGRNVWTFDAQEVEMPGGGHADQGGPVVGSRRAARLPVDPPASPERGRGGV